MTDQEHQLHQSLATELNQAFSSQPVPQTAVNHAYRQMLERQNQPDRVYYTSSIHDYNIYHANVISVGLIDPPDEVHGKYKKRKLKEYADPDFSKVKDILPKDMVPHAVMCPKEDVKARINSYLTT